MAEEQASPNILFFGCWQDLLATISWEQLVKTLETILHRIDYLAMILYIVGAIALGALFLITFSDIAARFLFNVTVWGTLEISEYLLVAIIFLALGFAQLTGTHVRVEMLLSRLGARTQSVLNIIALLMGIGFFIIMMLQTAERAYICWAGGILLPATTVKLPIFWPSAIGAFGCLILVISLFTQLIRNTIGLITGKVVGFVTWTR